MFFKQYSAMGLGHSWPSELDTGFVRQSFEGTVEPSRLLATALPCEVLNSMDIAEYGTVGHQGVWKHLVVRILQLSMAVILSQLLAVRNLTSIGRQFGPQLAIRMGHRFKGIRIGPPW